MPNPTPPSLQSPTALSHVPAQLQPLIDLAFNFRGTWCADSADVFAWISPKLWERTQHNPVQLLAEVGEARLSELAADTSFVAAVAAAWKQLDTHLHAPGWFGQRQTAEVDQSRRPFLAAYFCAEFGLTECFQIYSGGLGLLAGDHLKSAAGLAIPLVGVGLLYRCGYFHQSLNAAGEQIESYPEMDFSRQPVRRVCTTDGAPVRVSVDLPGRRVHIGVWCSQVGRVQLYLLDTNLPENAEHDRDITRNLYLGDNDMRVRQEIILGIGGVRALAAMGIEPTVCHMNEGHAAFMALERTRLLREKHSLSFDQAREATASGHVFTTHTPVPAGIDRFAPSLVTHYFQDYHDQLGLDLEGFLALGRENVADKSESFSMAVLAIRMSRFANGVSRLHGRVSRGMWKNIWPGTPRDDVPIGHVTNGVHASGWIGGRVAGLLDTATGKSWRENPQDDRAWERAADVSDADLWQCRQESRQSLVQWCRARVRDRLIARGAT
ncbi:MAG: alpha-glucan family phosphorylase, partial [Pyrinomonadaceae bacterium]|nr:alpha-glucan family phosphorylase [Phycisphaerales bacterium]